MCLLQMLGQISLCIFPFWTYFTLFAKGTFPSVRQTSVLTLAEPSEQPFSMNVKTPTTSQDTSSEQCKGFIV